MITEQQHKTVVGLTLLAGLALGGLGGFIVGFVLAVWASE